MSDISDLHRYLDLLTNKSQSAFIAPGEKDDAINMASVDLFNKYAPLYGADAEATAALDPFVQVYQVTPMNSPGGLVTFPTPPNSYTPGNFERLTSCYAVSYDNKLMRTVTNDIDIVSKDELSDRLKSQLKPVTYDWPVAVTRGKGSFQLYPIQPNTAVFTYLSTPVKAKYDFTTNGDVNTYVPGTSVQLEWSESYWPQIMFGALKYLGINLDNPSLTQFMDAKFNGQ